jgi:hypothetical protein
VVNGEHVYAVAILKAAFLNTNGRMPVPRLLEMFGHDEEVAPLSKDLIHIREVDDAITVVAGI